MVSAALYLLLRTPPTR
uniref:Uncharacterized protein n=1 Tax=Rhizophora mucronata TaxID=61149 RepID=A0A2P2JZ50_RHIMU